MTTSTQPGRPRTTALVLATVFVDVIGFGIILPILPGTADRMGASATLIGILVAAYSAIQFLLAPLWGRLSDRIGRRPVLLLGLGGSVLSYIVFAIAGSWQLLLISRLLDGASGATINVAQAWLADETTPELRARAMGQVGAAIGMGFIVGPILGGLSATGGSALAGWIAAAITFVNLVVASLILPDAPPPREEQVAVAEAHLAANSLIAPLAVLFLATLSFTVMYVVFPLWGEASLGASQSSIGYWFAFIGIFTAIAQGGLMGRMVKRLGETNTSRLGTLLLAIALGLLPFSGTNKLGLAGVLLVMGLGYGLAGPPMLGLISRRTRATRQGRALGVALSATSMARIIGPIAAGVGIALLGEQPSFLLAAALAATALVATAKVRSEKRESRIEKQEARKLPSS